MPALEGPADAAANPQIKMEDFKIFQKRFVAFTRLTH